MTSSSSQHLPTGLITLMFTDIEGSTKLLASLGDEYVHALADHRQILRDAVLTHAGSEVDTQGDAFFFVFPDADSALGAAVDVQTGLARHPWRRNAALKVRIGIHTGRPTRTEEGYVGLDLHRGARISATGHGGQVVLSAATVEEAAGAPTGARIRPLGAHRLKDLDQPMTLFDLVMDGLPEDFPPLRSIGARPTNLPEDLVDLVGRGDDVAAGVTSLSEGARLVTFTGPGGTGKTSLATRVARQILPDFPDGAFVVWLAPVQGAEFVAEAIASALGLRERPGGSTIEVVVDYLADREMLLLLDNFEHVMDAAPFVAQLLARAPRLRVLVTSRIPLRLPGEMEVPIQPLALVAGDQVLAPAVELFVTRARAVRPNLAIDESTLSAIRAICTGLDGLPLAIELAAARVRLMTPQAMQARLARPLELAAGGSRHADLRHQALRATIDYSVDLLTARLRTVFVDLSVFAGHFTVAAAEDVCDVDLDELAELLDHSLLRSFDDTDGETRLGMLETIRAYARETLTTRADAEAVHDRHARWCAQLAAPGGPDLLSGAHENYLDEFDAAQDDLRQALDWLSSSGQSVAALDLANDLSVFWDTRGQIAEGQARLEQVFAAGADAPERARARAMFSIARMAVSRGDGLLAEEFLVRALEMFRAEGDQRAVTLCLSHLGFAQLSRGEGLAASRRWNEQALATARTSGDPWSVAVALNNLSTTFEVEEAEHAGLLLAESLRIRRNLGEKRTLAITLGNIGEWAIDRGAYDDAREALDEALALAIDIGLQRIIAEARLNLAILARHDGDLETAKSLLDDAHARAQRISDVELVGRSVRLRAEVAEAPGNDTARATPSSDLP